ncbi:TPA: type VI secretion system ImpA family N-terminal domain-containing protein [Pseudomonas putida]|nr:type VI secretion system ImpA family N-terminal domain-containing protein [Pseudomonas putida]
MTALIEMCIRVGGDPRDFSEFAALREELAKLNHPACPDVDWARVEQLCLALFQKNGADLQSAAAFTLARSQRHGLEGMVQGMALIDALACEWLNVWPPMASLRLDILSWLFARMQALLRSLPMGRHSLPALEDLETELLRLQLRLDRPMTLHSLQALRQQIEHLRHRLQLNTAMGGAIQLAPSEPQPTRLMPIVIWPAHPVPDIQPTQRRRLLWLSAVAATLVLVSGLWWSGHGSIDQGGQGLVTLLQQKQPVPAPVRLDSLALFDAGSAELKPGSTKVLISALIDIKAQPGWLIVISGHSDDRGSPEQNSQLSHARASAVRGWMQRMGDIPDSCFAVQGVGGSQPVASNETQAGRAANRRVDISLVPQAGACGQSSAGQA